MIGATVGAAGGLAPIMYTSYLMASIANGGGRGPPNAPESFRKASIPLQSRRSLRNLPSLFFGGIHEVGLRSNRFLVPCKPTGLCG